MRTKRFGLNIFHKLLLSLLTVALIPLLAVWYVASSQIRSDAETTVSQHLVAATMGIANGIVSWDDTNVRALRQAARLGAIVSMDGAKQTPVLHAINDTYEWSFLVYVAEPGGSSIARSDTGANVNFGDRGYFQKAIRGGIGRQVVISKSTGKPCLSMGVPIRDQAGTTVGVLAMAMKLDDIAKAIVDTHIGGTGYAILLDADKKVIAAGKSGMSKTELQDLSDYPALKVDGISDQPTVYKQGGKKVLAYARKLPQGWTLLVEQDYEEAYASLLRLEHGASLLILITAVLVGILAVLLGMRMTRPINRLIAVTEQLSKGVFPESIPETSRGDEIGALARAIERLGVSIQMAMNRLRKKSGVE